MRRGGHGLALDQRHRVLDARQRRQPLGDLIVVVEVVAADLVDDDVAVEAQDLAEQLLAKAVHDRHHRDQREDAEQDAEERESGQHRDEPLLAARAQIAQRQHPFEGRKRPGVRRRRGHAGQIPLVALPLAGRRSSQDAARAARARSGASPPHRAPASCARPTCAP